VQFSFCLVSGVNKFHLQKLQSKLITENSQDISVQEI